MKGWIRHRGTDREANCAEVFVVLQGYLDGAVDDLTARRVRRHLRQCRRCGLEAETYQAIKDALARRAPSVDLAILERIKAFSERLLDDSGKETGSPA